MELKTWNKACKMEQYLIFKLMIKIHPSILMIFLSQLKTFIQKRQTYKTAVVEPFSKTETISKQFHHLRQTFSERKLQNL